MSTTTIDPYAAPQGVTRRMARSQSASAAEPVRDDAEDDSALTALSLRRTQARISGALAVPCVEHEAAPGDYCWDSALSRVRGLCTARYACGAAFPMFWPSPQHEELGELANAARLIQSRARVQLVRRHPNRHPVRAVAR